MSLEILKRGKLGSIFLETEIYELMEGNGYKVLSLPELDFLFAVGTIIKPTEDFPYFQFTGYDISFLKNNEFNNTVKKMIEEMFRIEERKYEFSGSNKWIIEG